MNNLNKKLLKGIFTSGFLEFIKAVQLLYDFDISRLPKFKPVFEKSDLKIDSNIIEDGLKIGSLARDYWSDFAKNNGYKVYDLDSSSKNIAKVIKKTEEFISHDEDMILFESAFSFKKTIIKPDILIYSKELKAFKIIEVKAVNSLKGEHYLDLIFQQYILIKLNYKIIDSQLMHINSKYKLTNETLDLEDFFSFSNSLYMKNFYKDLCEINFKNKELKLNYRNSVKDEYPKPKSDDKLAEKINKYNENLIQIQKFRNLHNIDNDSFLSGNITFLELSSHYERIFDGIYDEVEKFIMPALSSEFLEELINEETEKYYKEAFSYTLELIKNDYSKSKIEYLLLNLQKFVEKLKNQKFEEFSKQEELFKGKEVNSKFGLLENLYNQTSEKKGQLRAILNLDYIEEIEKKDISILKKNSRISLSEINLIQISTHKKKELYINNELIKKELSKYKTPIYMIDFETISGAVPIAKGTSPYQQVPFQYSMHIIQDKDLDFFYKKNYFNREEILNYAYLSNGENSLFYSEFTKNFLMHASRFGDGTYVAFHKPFESSVIKKIIESGDILSESEIKKLKYINENLIDLKDLYYNTRYSGNKKQTNILYYDFKLNGSFSIKSALPSIDKSFNYKKDLSEIHNGSDALNAFKNKYNKKLDSNKWVITRKNLLKYCEQDTWSMIKIYEYFLNINNK